MAKIVIKRAGEWTYPLRLLLYGPSGSGKTYLAMQAELVEDMRPALLLSGDRGHATARRIGIQTALIDTAKDLDMILAAIKGGKLDVFKTVIIDGLSQFYDSVVLGQSGGEVPQIQDWLRASFDVKGYVRDLVRMERNVIVTCLDQHLKEEASGTIWRAPLVPGKQAWRLAEAFDIVGHVEIQTRAGKIERHLRVQPSARTIAKDRDGRMGADKFDITWKLGSGNAPPLQLMWKRWQAGAHDKMPDPESMLKVVGVEDDVLGVYTEGGEPALDSLEVEAEVEAEESQ